MIIGTKGFTIGVTIGLIIGVSGFTTGVTIGVMTGVSGLVIGVIIGTIGLTMGVIMGTIGFTTGVIIGVTMLGTLGKFTGRTTGEGAVPPGRMTPFGMTGALRTCAICP